MHQMYTCNFHKNHGPIDCLDILICSIYIYSALLRVKRSKGEKGRERTRIKLYIRIRTKMDVRRLSSKLGAF